LKDKEAQEQDDPLEQIVEAVLKSSKNKNVCGGLIRNIGMRELARHRNLRTAIKSTKNKLHQIGGAYFVKKPDYSFWIRKLRDAKKLGANDLFCKTCAEIMTHHYSTRERLSILSEFYSRIFALLPTVHSIMDVACGFHPLSIPWMPLPVRAEYYAYDIYNDMIDFLNRFFALLESVDGHAEALDVLQGIPKKQVDLAFMLDTIPCLEQVDESAGFRILNSIDADYVLVSFPAHTLGGREKDMRRHYEARFCQMTQGTRWKIEKLEFPSELAFMIKKGL
jgi:16S rRNA (guanine(1405)-N(7))-methyltransferase